LAPRLVRLTGVRFGFGCADAFRVLASRYRYVEPAAPKPWKPDVKNPVLMVNRQTPQVEYVGGFSIFEWAEKRRKKREAEI
jgi:hypothetical protein